MIFALVGNQNSGKTSLFNCLTGSNQHVGNFPGVTVEQKLGEIKGHKEYTIVDLPGVYSIRPYSNEETVTRDFIINEKPDGIINIVDATNIERNLYLTLQLIELGIPMVLALNMMDEVRNNGGVIDHNNLSDKLGIPVIPISAAKNEGISEVIDKIIYVSKNKISPKKIDFCNSGPLHRCIHSVSHIIEDHALDLNLSSRFCATKLIEGDEFFIKKLKLSQNELEILEHSIFEMESETQMDKNAAMADMRYAFIEDLCSESVTKYSESKERIRSKKIDTILTNKYLALPVFFLIMMSIFYLTFNVIGSYLSDVLALGISKITYIVNNGLVLYGINPVVRSLLIDGVFNGVGSVLSFLPIIVTLFFFLSILEDTGYMARVAFIMDNILRKIGLSGRSFVPMLIGFGCSVPAIMASRTLSSNRDKKMTILLVPFMSCSAKIPIYAVFTAAFFEKYQALVMISLYLSGIFVGIITAIILNKTSYSTNPMPFIMELPNYRLPSAKSVLLMMWEKAKDFFQKAFTLIFVASIIIWFLQSFDAKFNVVSDSSYSMLAYIGKLIAPIFKLVGFNDWRVATALFAGVTAKEAVVSTLSVLIGTNIENLGNSLRSIFTPLSAFSFLIFTLLYTPCIAAVATIRRELGSVFHTSLVVIAQCLIAWIVSFVVYNVGGLIV